MTRQPGMNTDAHDLGDLAATKPVCLIRLQKNEFFCFHFRAQNTFTFVPGGLNVGF